MEKINSLAQKIRWCPCCHKVTLKLVKKVWEERPYKNYRELRGYYQCPCGNKCYMVFAREPVASFIF